MIRTTNEESIGIDLPKLLWTGTDWQEQAACIDSDLDFFEIKNRRLARAAKDICEGCPVKDECLEFALRNKIEYGIWGGLTPQER